MAAGGVIFADADLPLQTFQQCHHRMLNYYLSREQCRQHSSNNNSSYYICGICCSFLSVISPLTGIISCSYYATLSRGPE